MKIREAKCSYSLPTDEVIAGTCDVNIEENEALQALNEIRANMSLRYLLTEELTYELISVNIVENQSQLTRELIGLLGSTNAM